MSEKPMARLTPHLKRCHALAYALGAASFRPGEDAFAHSVFQRADERMYERKQQLKSMGSITRD